MKKALYLVSLCLAFSALAGCGDFGIRAVYDAQGNLCGVERFTGEIRLG